MKIVKYTKLKKNNYKIELDNKTNLIFHEEIILKHNLLIKKELTEELIVQLEEENNLYVGYDLALKFIGIRLRSENEIKEHLLKKEISINEVNKIISRLKKYKYVNDELFVTSYVNDKFNLSNDGPYKILKSLDKFKVSSDLNYIIFDKFTNKEQLERIENTVDKYVKRRTTNSTMAPKQRLERNLINLGYERSLVYSFLNSYEFDDSELREKEYEKLKKRYSKKYEGTELELIVKQKLYQKGYK